MNILFVCTGNSCRSVMAEGLFKKMTASCAGDFSVSSAGVSTWDGMPSTEETVSVMKQEGIDVSGHRTRRLTEEMLQSADRIYAMEEIHRERILELWPQAESKVRLLGEFASLDASKEKDANIPDPIRMSGDFYKNVFLVIQDCVSNVVKSL